ncbi:MAG: SH3 domain-containing protein [Anaerolineales bacterium]|nr:SH3 domain-containing protein [Anaerolineales bacterium]
MLRPKRLVPFILLALTALACAIPSVTLPGAGSISTSAAETVIAGLTQSVTETFTPSITPTFTRTFTPTLVYLSPRVPSETPTLVVSAGAETSTLVATETATQSPVTMSVSRPTNCRTGPGKSYEVVGSLLVGDTVPVLGRDPTNEYWYIPNPYVFTEFCWVWGEYATFTGNQLYLPVVQPPPTPTSTATTVPTIEYSLKSAGSYSCDSRRWVNITITNESEYLLNSIKIVAHDKTRNITRSVTYNNFPIVTGCDGLTWIETIGGGSSTIVSGPKFDLNIRGDKLDVSVTICTAEDLAGICTTREIKITP